MISERFTIPVKVCDLFFYVALAHLKAQQYYFVWSRVIFVLFIFSDLKTKKQKIKNSSMYEKTNTSKRKKKKERNNITIIIEEPRANNQIINIF